MAAVKVFVGKLLPTIRKGFAEAPELNEKGKQIHDVVLDGNGKPIIYQDTAGRTRTRRKIRKKRYKEMDNVFNVYHCLADLSTYVNLRYEKAIKSRKEGEEIVLDLGLTKELKEGLSFIRRRFKRKLTPESVSSYSKIMQLMGDIETTIEMVEGPFAEREAVFSKLRGIGRDAKFRKLMKELEEIIGNLFEIMGMNVSVKTRMNPETKVNYMQYKLKKGLELELESVDEEEARKAEMASKMLTAQEKDLERRLADQGYQVMSRAFFEGNSKEVVKIAYRKGIDSVVPVDKPAPFRATSTDEKEIERQQREYERRPDVVAYNKYIKERESYVEGVYSAAFLEESTTNPDNLEYKVFGTVEEFKSAFRSKALKEQALQNIFPDVEKDGENYKISYKQSWGVHYSLSREDEPAFLEEQERTVQVSDGNGNTKGLRRVFSVRKALVNGQARDVITKGRYKGFLLEDMINVQGRLIEGSYKIKIDGQTMEREMIQDGELKFLVTEQSDPERILEGKISSRLLEPYITLSEDKTRLCIGIPSTPNSTGDRKVMQRLSEEIATIEGKLQVPVPFEDQDLKSLTKEQKALRTKAKKANTANPFYYFRAEDYEIIRDALGSVAMSKAASDFLDRYFDQLTKRDRALNAENLVNYTPDAIGGFVEEIGGKPFQINNKQKEALAWMDANDYSGLMALDTGVGKTLFSVGAIRKAMAEEEGQKRRFLFVSPARLVGNLEKEINKFIKPEERSETLSRVDEMDYKTFSSLMKESGTPYFKRTYFACFFDEVNEALSKTATFKAVSGLLHPRKVLLTASAMEKDPVDLYKFVTLAQGVEYEKKGENAWAQRYCDQIGGRNIGLSPDPRVRQEFLRWVKANAFFAYKEEVDFAEINQPTLQPPRTTSVSVKMNKAVQKEYRKVASEVARELEAMLAKYRDADYDPARYDYEEERILRGRKKVVTKTIKDLAKVTLPKSVKTLMRLATDPEQVLGDKAGKNPKLEACKSIVKDSPNSRIVFFTSDNKMADKTVIENAKARPAKVHCVLKASGIAFYQVSKGKVKKLATANKKTDISSEKWQKIEDRIRLASEDKAREEDASWAIRIVQEYIAENDYVGTITCTDAYARGFNFQRFQKVVHLDRGKGFDSELLKQRTARAYRTGQKGVVDEIYLDSSIGSEEGDIAGLDADMISIEEIQKLLNQKDQEFFQEIIQGGMSQSLIESLDAVEDITGDELARQKKGENGIAGSFLERLLDPSDEALARFEEKEAKKEDNPLQYSANLKAGRYDILFEENRIRTNIRDKDTLYDVLDMAGCALIAPRLLEVNVQEGLDGYEVSGTQGRNSAYFNVLLMKNSSGDLSVMNQNPDRTLCASEEAEANMLFTQVASALKRGSVKEILQKIGAPDDELPKYGFDGVVTSTIAQSLRRDPEMVEYLTKTDALKDTKVSDILSAVDASGKSIGLDWWRMNGGPMILSFDLSSGGVSMRVANAYFKRKCQEMDVDLDDFFQRPISLFNHREISCWRDYLSSSASEAEKIEYVKRNEEELKSTLLSSKPDSYAAGHLVDELSYLGLDYSIFIERVPTRLASQSKDDSIFKDIWQAIGNERINKSIKIELIEDSDPSDLTSIISVKERD